MCLNLAKDVSSLSRWLCLQPSFLGSRLFCETLKVRKLSLCFSHCAFPLHLLGYNGKQHKASKHLLCFLEGKLHSELHPPRLVYPSINLQGVDRKRTADSSIVKKHIELVSDGCRGVFLLFIEMFSLSHQDVLALKLAKTKHAATKFRPAKHSGWQ